MVLIRGILFLACFAGVVLPGNAQERRFFCAHRASGEIRLDGRLDEPAWSEAETAGDFLTLKPQPGLPPAAETFVRLLYTDRGIYIGAILKEPGMDRLGTELAERDNLDDRKRIDWFGVAFDCYQNGLQGFGFLVTAAGVQVDLKFTADGDDPAWDAVWDSQVAILDDAWSCEMHIPYSALRFPQQYDQTWGVQFGRRSAQRQEECFWNPIRPEVEGFINQAGTLEGIYDIKPPLRLSATPFFAVYAEHASDHPRSSWGTSYTGGMDVKYGISDAFTLDMTLIPDFGQVQSDNQVLNLSPFEVRFAENRQFFTEGTELFNKAGLFYSRRVGGRPYYADDVEGQIGMHEVAEAIPADTRLINATKISGRNRQGLGIGYFNAVSPRDHIAITDTLTNQKRNRIIQPWTNYNVFVLDQNLPNNSYVALINTNVLREGTARDANVTGVDVEFRNATNTYKIAGKGAAAQQWSGQNAESGYMYDVELGRISGNLNWEIGHGVESETYDPNDLGFLYNNNSKVWRGWVDYSEYEPFGPFLSGGIGTFWRYEGLYKFPGRPDQQVRPNLYTHAGGEFWAYGQFRNFWRVSLSAWIQPTDGYDYFEPRIPGRFFRYPANKNFTFSFNSDNRKPYAFGGSMEYTVSHETGKHRQEIYGYARSRLNDRFSLNYEIRHAFATLDRGWVNFIGNDIILGARDLRDLNQILTLAYGFNARTTLNLRLRHNWTRVQYTEFYTLLESGELATRDYAENEDQNFNAWTVDMQFRWRFAAGSDIFVVWKNNIQGLNQNSLISFGENLRTLFDQPQSNSLSLKVIYYLGAERF